MAEKGRNTRKLVKQGRNALTLTLPAFWLKKRRLESGDSVTLTEQGDALIVRPDAGTTVKSVNVDLRQAEKSTVWHLLSTAYIEGHDTINILHDNAENIQEVTQHLLGTVLDELTPTRARLSSIMSAPREPIDAILRRCGHLFVELAKTVERVAKKESRYEDCKVIERILDDNLLYCLRTLNVFERDERAYQRFLLCMWIEMGADYLSILAKEIKNEKELAETVRKGVEDYVQGIFSNDYKNLYSKLRLMRSKINKKTFVEGVAFALADMLYNNIGVFVHESKYQNI